MKKITITNALSKEIKERHSGTQDIIAEGMDQEQDTQNYMEASDGYHTFTELYDHRIILFLALCRYFIQGKASYDSRNVWISKLHHDGSNYDNWFIMGIGKKAGNQISYHLPEKYWDEASKNAEILDRAPEWDGHSPNDVLERLKNL